MELIIQILKLFAGIGLFLFGMYLLEESLKNLSGRKFKIFLQRVTKNRISAVLGGAFVTGILQSSSMVSFMVLAFVGAGVFTMRNAMAIILGANLGTTLDSWLVALLGFKVNIEIAAYPAVCIGGFLLILFSYNKTIKNIAYFLFGFGLLFIALSFMKTSMEAQVESFDFSKWNGMPLIFFLFTGFVITSIIQSSSVTMALTLSALHAGAIAFPAAAAIVLGSETGTTIKLLFASIGGNATKKRVVFGNLLFNIFLTVFTFIFLNQILYLVTVVLGISDSVIGLVTFSTIINLISIIIFLPFLDPFVSFLEKFFKESEGKFTAFIQNADIKEPETALDLFRRETEFFIHNVMIFNLELFEVKTVFLNEHSHFSQFNEKTKFMDKSSEEKYVFLKQMQGEIQAFYLAIRQQLQSEHDSQFSQLISSVRGAMYALKSINDVNNNIQDLKKSSKNIKFNMFLHHQKQIEKLYKELDLLIHNQQEPNKEKLKAVFNSIEQNYLSTLDDFYKNASNAPIESIDITTIINFNREMFTANKAITMAVKDLLLDEKEAEVFNELPIYHN